jgi:hypothetical protein
MVEITDDPEFLAGNFSVFLNDLQSKNSAYQKQDTSVHGMEQLETFLCFMKSYQSVTFFYFTTIILVKIICTQQNVFFIQT